MSVSDLAWTAERAAALDGVDPLSHVRDRFVVPKGLIYLDGNSLGPLPRAAPARLAALLEDEWAAQLVGGWTDAGWMSAPERLGALIAPLIGARPDEVIVTDTTTVALTKAVLAARKARPGRSLLLSTPTNFPSDLYALAGVARLLGDVEVRHVLPHELGSALSSLGNDVAVLALTHVDFRTGEILDLPALTSAAHDAGALTVWDLSHSAGAVPVGARRHGVDLAVGCGYKFLNGGPGAPAFIYVRRELQGELDNPLPGWLGHETPFAFGPEWRPAEGMRRWLTSTPPVAGMAALEAALEGLEGVSIESIRAKSTALTQLFVEAVLERCEGRFELVSPADADRRGSQVTFRHAEAAAVVSGLARQGVIGDFRPPDLCRFGFGSTFLGYAETFAAAETVAAMET